MERLNVFTPCGPLLISRKAMDPRGLDKPPKSWIAATDTSYGTCDQGPWLRDPNDNSRWEAPGIQYRNLLVKTFRTPDRAPTQRKRNSGRCALARLWQETHENTLRWIGKTGNKSSANGAPSGGVQGHPLARLWARIRNHPPRPEEMLEEVGSTRAGIVTISRAELLAMKYEQICVGEQAYSASAKTQPGRSGGSSVQTEFKAIAL